MNANARAISTLPLHTEARNGNEIVTFAHASRAPTQPESLPTLAQLTERGAQCWPEQAALWEGDRCLTFAALHAACERFASELARAGVRRGDRVILLAKKELESAIAVLATWRIGAVCVPLDPCLPERRLALLFADVEPRAVVARARLEPLVEALRTEHAADYELLALDACASHASTCGTERSFSEPEASDVAYIMYTSGSSGLPKGVMIEHGALLSFFEAHNERVGIAPGDRCMNTGPFHFDVIMLDLFLPLYFGATALMTPELPLPKLLLKTLERHRATHFYAIGTVLALMTGDGHLLDEYDLTALRVLQTGAEVCNPRVVNEWLRRLPRLELLNSYGPTEVSVGCLSFRAGPGPLEDCDVPIGGVHRGCEAIVVDPALRVLEEPYQTGELLVRGAQVMRGYWRRPSEERAAFVELGGARYYRTGDLAYRDAEGLWHYLGRVDREVKVNGQRIHLHEVQRCLESHPDVQGAVVGTLEQHDGRLRIAAAVSLRCAPESAVGRRLLEHLSAYLMPAAVPVALLLCRALPRTSSGKADLHVCMQILSRRLRGARERIFVLEESSLGSPEASPSLLNV